MPSFIGRGHIQKYKHSKEILYQEKIVLRVETFCTHLLGPHIFINICYSQLIIVSQLWLADPIIEIPTKNPEVSKDLSEHSADQSTS